MIPKVIHYCWFGNNPLPNEVLMCIESWKKYCPDYEIILWNENNFPIFDFEFSKKAYEAKKYAFVSDVARIYALQKFGGVYMDTDMELIKPIDDLLGNDAVIGFEDETFLNSAFLGCKKNNIFLKDILNFYKNINDFNFYNTDYKVDKTSYLNYTIPKIITQIIQQKSFDLNSTKIIKIPAYCTFYPIEYFYPKNYRNGILNITKNTYSIHHYDASWQDINIESDYSKARINYYFNRIKDENIEIREILKAFKNNFRINNLNLILLILKNTFQNRFK